LRGGFFSSSKWLATFRFLCGDMASARPNANAQTGDIGYLKASTIPDIFLAVDKLLLSEWVLKRTFDEALSGS
jgi:hypothetical protein